MFGDTTLDTHPVSKPLCVKEKFLGVFGRVEIDLWRERSSGSYCGFGFGSDFV